jgi:hypothetical protein
MPSSFKVVGMPIAPINDRTVPLNSCIACRLSMAVIPKMFATSPSSCARAAPSYSSTYGNITALVVPWEWCVTLATA